MHLVLSRFWKNWQQIGFFDFSHPSQIYVFVFEIWTLFPAWTPRIPVSFLPMWASDNEKKIMNVFPWTRRYVRCIVVRVRSRLKTWYLMFSILSHFPQNDQNDFFHEGHSHQLFTCRSLGIEVFWFKKWLFETSIISGEVFCTGSPLNRNSYLNFI